MSSQNTTARIAGALYLFIVITGIFSLRYFPSVFYAWDDPARTIANITSHETLFRFAIVVGVVGYIAFFLLPFVLYKLLGVVNKDVAVAMVALAVVSVPFSLNGLM